MGQRSIRIPDDLDALILELALERQTSYTEIVIWAAEKYLDVEREVVARQDRRTVSSRVPLAEDSRLPPAAKRPSRRPRTSSAAKRDVRPIPKGRG